MLCYCFFSLFHWQPGHCQRETASEYFLHLIIWRPVFDKRSYDIELSHSAPVIQKCWSSSIRSSSSRSNSVHVFGHVLKIFHTCQKNNPSWPQTEPQCLDFSKKVKSFRDLLNIFRWITPPDGGRGRAVYLHNLPWYTLIWFTSTKSAMPRKKTFVQWRHVTPHWL
jgi:hypothetical protein